VFDLDLTLKNNELFLVGRSETCGGMHEAGLYLRDTRFLSTFTATVSGVPLDVLSVQTLSASEAIITSTTQSGHEDRTGIPGSDLVVLQRIRLGAALNITFEAQAFGGWASTVTLDIEMAADFRDMFDVRGMTPKQRPRLHPPEVLADRTVSFSATGSDGQTAKLDVGSEPSPLRAGIASGDRVSDNGAVPVAMAFSLDLAHGDSAIVDLSLLPTPVGAAHEAEEAVRLRLKISTDNRDLEAMALRADLDLAMLQTDFPEGSMPSAGIPWFIAPFGRDSLIVALQTMQTYPERAWATLRVLAANQGDRLDAFREEEPGKILHEIRYGDMARTHQIPHTPYFGSIDSTPLFVMTFAQAWRVRQDEGMYDELVPHIRRALAWIEEYGDLDGDGLVEFGAKAEDGVHITQQGWKDSHDSLHWANGDQVEGPVALVEVQGYVYAAYAWMADVATMRGDEGWAAELRDKADRVRKTVEDTYWLEGEGYYAQALDGNKRPVDAISSNPGHLLFCGLPSPERAALMVDRLMRGDMLTRWGIRTLSSTMSTYNPMSYHNGSIWPHDNSLTICGMKAFGFDEAASTVAECLIRLSAHDTERRLSELYCGFDSDDDRLGPVNYPVSCRPQAWAAGCAHLIVRTMLGPH
jgi:glycogen debranching enzyme